MVSKAQGGAAGCSLATYSLPRARPMQDYHSIEPSRTRAYSRRDPELLKLGPG
jgi:hypothetical protein